MPMQESIYTLLSAIRQRPNMFLTSKSVTGLMDFLCGYSCGRRTSWHAANEPPFYFEPWCIYQHFGGSGGATVIQHLLRTIGDEARAFDRYFELVDEFKARQLQCVYEAKLTKAHWEKYRKRERANYSRNKRAQLRMTQSKREQFWFVTFHGISGGEPFEYLECVPATKAAALAWARKVYGIEERQFRKIACR